METDKQDQSMPDAAPGAYDSNPFTAAWTGIQKLIKTNSQTVVGTALFNILLTVVLVVTLFVIAMSLISFGLKHNSYLEAAYQIPTSAPYSFLTSMSDASIYVTWIIGVAIIIFVLSLIESLQLTLGVAAARSVPLKFGALLKQSTKFVLPILGFVGLMLLVIIVASIVIGLLAVPLGFITIVVGLVAVIAGIYAALRLSFTVYSIIDEHLGPVAAMKRSWGLTEGHIIETIGSGAVALLIVTVPDIILTALARVTEGLPLLSGLFGLLGAIVATVLLLGATMSMAERYVQIRATKEGSVAPAALSPFNYLAIAVFLVLAPILSALSPKPTDNSQLQDPLNGLSSPTQDINNTSPDNTTLN